MEQHRPSGFRIERLAAWLFIGALMLAIFIYLSGFLQPFVLAIIIWYFIYELKYLGGRIKFKGQSLPNWLLTILAFVIIVLVFIGIGEIVSHNIRLVIERLPDYIQNSKQMLESMKTIDGFESIQSGLLERLETFDFRPWLTGLLNGLSTMAGNIFLIIIYVFFILAEEKLFKKKLNILVKDQNRFSSVTTILNQITQAVRTYVFVKTQMSILTGFLSYLVLIMLGVDFPILWAFLIFLLNYIPYIGSFVATLLPSAFAVFQFQSLSMFLWVFVLVEIIQLLVGNILEPKVMGKTLNLSPLGVLLALTFWGVIWGVLGMIISVPITSILVIIADNFPNTRFIAIWLSETGEVANGSTPIVPPVQTTKID